MAATALRVVALVVGLVLAVTPALAGDVGDASRADAQDCPDEEDFCASFPDDAIAASDWPYRTNLTVVGNVSAVEITEAELNASQLADIFGGESTEVESTGEPTEDADVPAQADDASERTGSPRGTESRKESTRGVPGFGVRSALVALALWLALLRR